MFGHVFIQILMVMLLPWIFSSEKARRFLMENGYVYTVRKHLKKKLGVKDYFTDHYGGKSLGSCYGILIRKIHDPTAEKYVLRAVLAAFVDKSGFSSVEEWLDEIKRLNHGKIPSTLYLYYVALVKEGG